jgi:hypothetical protein
MPEMVLRDVASRRGFYLAAKRFYVGVDVDGLACPLHHPMTSRQTRGQDLLSGVVLSRRCSGQ